MGADWLQNLRNELYCQVLKQLTMNPRMESLFRGWVLLTLMTGCFSPTDTLFKYVVAFLIDSTRLQGIYLELAQLAVYVGLLRSLSVSMCESVYL